MFPPSNMVKKRALVPSQETRATTMENPSNPILGCDVENYVYNTPSSGINVSEDTAWNYSAVYAAIRLLSETVAQLPLHLYRRSGVGREKATDHPLFNIITNKPSPHQTSFVWRETQMAQTLTQGNGYAYIKRDTGGSVRGLEVLPAGVVTTSIDTDSTLLYRATYNGQQTMLAQQNVLHVTALSHDGLLGVSPIKAHREALGLTAAAQRFGSTFFSNGTSFGGVLKHPSGLSRQAKERLKQGWDDFRGRGYNGALILDEGMDYQAIGIPPEDAQFLETRRFQISEIARIYNIPPHMLRDLEKSSFNNIEQQSAEYLRYTMTPWLVKWEQELNRKLLTEEEQQEYYFKFSAGGLLRGTQKDRYEAYGRAILDGWMSRNEVRELEELNPVEGLDDYLQPLNMVAVGEDQEVEEITDEEPVSAENTPEMDDDGDESGQRSRFAALAFMNGHVFSKRLKSAIIKLDSNSSDVSELIVRINKMSEQLIYPIFEAAGVQGRDRWGQWVESIPLDKPTDSASVAAAILTIIGDDHG